LGHVPVCVVTSMATKQLVDGLKVDLSEVPEKCEDCLMGKQHCSPVPKIRQGLKSDYRLQQVHVDLCGPFIRSRNGNYYSMDIIDDYSSLGWAVPLPSK
ncbi:hypothetical protein DL96DRAFT_1422155, partial [Flagelloscypha sp. PMI_526]